MVGGDVAPRVDRYLSPDGRGVARTMADRAQQPWSSSSGGLAFTGLLFIGLAVGIITGDVAGFVMVGLGLGFLAMALVGGPRGRSAAGLLFVGSLMTGIGLGLLLGNAAIGVLLGLGVGFLLMGVARRGADGRPDDT